MEGVNKMNRILFLCVVVMGVSFSFNLKAETVFYCESKLATGFIKQGGKWKTSNFSLERYTIKFNNDYSKLYGLDERRPYICSSPYINASDALACLSGYSNGESFLFNKRTKRFVFSTPSLGGGYDSTLTDPDTDTLQAGTCKKF